MSAANPPENNVAGGIALRMADQGWRGLLPLLPHDATPHIRLAPEKRRKWPAAAVRRREPGRRAGWSLLPDWRGYADDSTRPWGGPAGPGSTSACGPAMPHHGWRSSTSTCCTQAAAEI